MHETFLKLQSPAPPRELMNDVVTRWAATENMVSSFLILRVSNFV